MQLTLSGQLKQFLRVMQGALFPALEEQLGPLTGKLRQLIAVLELVQIEAIVGSWHGGVGRPARHERAIARAFVAKRPPPERRWVWVATESRRFAAEAA
jgi:hypothetical protein